MLSTLPTLLAVVLLQFILYSPQKANARILDCIARGDGAVVVRGRYWYTCQDGHFRKDGCLDNKKNKIRINEAYVENGYEMTCYISDDGRLHIKQSGCVVNGQRYGPGDTWAGAKFWYTCARQGDYIVQDVSGCVVDNRRIRENQRAVRGQTLYECRLKDTGAIGLCAIGCATGVREYLGGETWTDEKFEYRCVKRGGWYAEVIACLQAGRNYKPYQEWTYNGAKYRCDVPPGGTTGSITRLSYL